MIRLGYESKTTLAATKSPPTRDLEWGAGFLEGEACFYGHPRRPSEHVDVAQVNREPLDRLLALFGGTIRLHRAGSEKWKDTWLWRVSGARARGVMMTLYSLLSRHRKSQIRAALGVS